MKLKAISLVLLFLVLTACNNAASTTGDPAAAVQQYLQAKIASQQDTLRGLLCAAMEADLEREAMSFSGVKAELENVACTYDAGSSTVSCTGNIAAEYNNEKSRFPLGKYKVVQENGQWKWCGETR